MSSSWWYKDNKKQVTHFSNHAFKITTASKWFLCFLDVTFFPFLSSDIPECQTDSLGRNPEGLLYLHCISPTTSFALLVSFHLSLGPVSLRGKECVSPFALSLSCFGAKYTEMQAVHEKNFAYLSCAFICVYLCIFTFICLVTRAEQNSI